MEGCLLERDAYFGNLTFWLDHLWYRSFTKQSVIIARLIPDKEMNHTLY